MIRFVQILNLKIIFIIQRTTYRYLIDYADGISGLNNIFLLILSIIIFLNIILNITIVRNIFSENWYTRTHVLYIYFKALIRLININVPPTIIRYSAR